MYLLFDLDRTLWDFEGNADITFRSMFDEYHLGDLCHTDLHTFHAKYREINNMLWDMYRNGTLTKEVLYIQRFVLPLQHFGMHDCGKLARELGDYYVLEGPKQQGLMPHARELLEALTLRPHPLAIITNGFSEAQLPKMRTSHIDHYFKYFFLSEELGYMKPDRRFFDEALKRLGATANECLVIGDDIEVDIMGAHNAGIGQIYYNPTGVYISDRAFHPTYEVSDLLEVLPIVDQLTAEMKKNL